MQLHSLRIEGFRKHKDTTVIFSDSTFLIGENNVGKSSVLYALDYLLGVKTSIPADEYFTIEDENGAKTKVEQIVLTAEFRNIPISAQNWRGFKGRLLKYETDGKEDTGLKFMYRKTYDDNGKVKIETLENPKIKKAEYENCKTISDFIDAGLDESELPNEVKSIDYDKNLTAKEKKLLDEVDSIFDINESEERWIENPGGIPQNVLSKLPKYLLIPAQDREAEISGTSGTLQTILSELFNEVRESSENYKKAQKYLELLAEELDPGNKTTEISKMIGDLNGIISDVFPDTGINAVANLSDADKVIKPNFEIQMSSNITTSSKLQGTGLIRSTVFALLRYKALRDNRRETEEGRTLIIGFEEPEIYLHPNAISKMRDTIYHLAETGANQIVCTTHSPLMIDLGKKPRQILNNLFLEKKINDGKEEITVGCTAFNVTKEFLALQDGDKDYIKMLLRVEESLAKCFFVKKILIVEGDTEQVVFNETIARMPEKIRNVILSDWYILRARGKAAIIPMVRYLKAMGIEPYVVHDKDGGKTGAEIFNKPIQDTLNNDGHLFVLENCIEDVLGYTAPTADKPYKAYKYIKDNCKGWPDLPEKWRQLVQEVFEMSI